MTKTENNLQLKRRHNNGKKIKSSMPTSYSCVENIDEKLKDENFAGTKVKNSESRSFLRSKEEKFNVRGESTQFSVKFQIDIIATVLFLIGLATRLYKLSEPRSIVFDELHYGKYISLYMNQIFFFDYHPPLGKQLIALAASLAGFDGQFKFEKIGTIYAENVPVFALRLVPAICGSLLIPTAYHLMLELEMAQWTSAMAGILLVCDNALLTQSRFMLMESILLFFALFGLLCIVKFKKSVHKPFSFSWWSWLILSFSSLTCSLCVKYVGAFSYLLGLLIVTQSYWVLLCDRNLPCKFLTIYLFIKTCAIIFCSISVYLVIFYLHLSYLTKAGPHDSVMTSAFQASLEGGLASITKGQPLEVGHGSQITLRHTYGRTCWLHSHPHVYPLRYPDKRGSSHQQQVTCYSFKDVNNWWIVKRPDRNDLIVSHPVDAIQHGDIIQLIHGITSRALNSHDVAAPMSPQNQEVSCYVDYNVSMPAQNLWKIDIVNREQVGVVWHTIQSQIRLIHVNSSQVLKFSGRQLPEWGFNQHEIVTDRVINQPDSIWNVEEHRYTKILAGASCLASTATYMEVGIILSYFHYAREVSWNIQNCSVMIKKLTVGEDQKERERDLVNAEMIPIQATSLSFWEKLLELQYKMLFSYQEPLQSHMYSSDPMEWPLLTRTTAYWVSSHTNAQVHLLGNLVIWYSGTLGFIGYAGLLAIYLLRRRRHCFDLPPNEWSKFCTICQILLTGYILHYLPYFFMEKTLFLHHYLPAFVFKALLLAAFFEHCDFLSGYIFQSKKTNSIFKAMIGAWCVWVVFMFKKFSVLSYGTTPLSPNELIRLRWRDTWHFILHKE